MQTVQKRWHRLRGYQLLADVIDGVKFKDGVKLDRDMNAAINLRNKAVSSTASACGEISAGQDPCILGEQALVKLASVKQEVNAELLCEQV